MPGWGTITADFLWRGALGAIPLALLVGAICRFVPCRPTTRHTLWLVVLIWFVAAGALPTARLPDPVANLGARETAPIVSDSTNPRLTGNESTLIALPDPQRLPSEPVEASISPTAPSPGVGLDAAMPAPTPPRTVARLAPSGSDVLAPVAEPGGRLFALGAELDNAYSWIMQWLADAWSAHDAQPDPIHSFDVVDPRFTFAGEHDPAGLSNSITQDIPPLEPAPLRADSSGPLPASSEDLPSHARHSHAADSTVARWLVALQQIRDAVGRLPTMPAAIWIWGTFIAVAVCLLRVLAFRWRLRGATRPPIEVQRLVAQCARRMGLRRPPTTLMVQSRQSPMVFCGLRPKLILPIGLWADLDDISRRAVVCHELAHLRRRDHLVCWFESIVGCLYWWHPLVWWARHRLHEEAEFCCDAWVTWLLPKHRRQYAEALLVAQGYVKRDGPATPVLSMGMSTVRANRFARRLTMVMTGSQRPRVSATGALLALVVAVAGWTATPANSCPPEATTPTPPARPVIAIAPGAAATPAVMVAPLTPCPPETVPAPVAVNGPRTGVSEPMPRVMTVYGDGTPAPAAVYSTTLAPAARAPDGSSYVIAHPAPPGGGDARLEERLRRLEENLARLNERLEKMSEGNWRGGAGGGKGLSVPAAPKKDPFSRTAPKPRAGGGAGGLGGAMSVPGQMNLFGGVAPGADAGKSSSRFYAISSKQKAEAVAALMIRDDVPVLVRPDDKGIHVVNAPETNHNIFRAFLDMIDPDGRNLRGGDKVSSGAHRLGETLESLSLADAERQATVAAELSAAAKHHAALGDLKTAAEALKLAERAAADQARASEKEAAAREKAVRKALENALKAEEKAKKEAKKKGKGSANAHSVLQEQLKTLATLRDELAMDHRGRHELLAALSNDIERLHAEMSGNETQLELLERQRADLETEAAKLRSDARDIEAARAAEITAQGVRQREDQVRDAMRTLEKLLREREGHLERAEGRLDQAGDMLEELNDELRNMEEHLKKAPSGDDDEDDATDDLRSQIRGLLDQVARYVSVDTHATAHEAAHAEEVAPASHASAAPAAGAGR